MFPRERERENANHKVCMNKGHFTLIIVASLYVTHEWVEQSFGTSAIASCWGWSLLLTNECRGRGGGYF